MAPRIEFHKHGGPDVLKAVELTPVDPAENEIRVENKAHFIIRQEHLKNAYKNKIGD